MEEEQGKVKLDPSICYGASIDLIMDYYGTYYQCHTFKRASIVKKRVTSTSTISNMYWREGIMESVLGVCRHTDTIESTHASLSTNSKSPMNASSKWTKSYWRRR